MVNIRSKKTQYHHYIPRFILKTFSDGTVEGGEHNQIKVYGVQSQSITLQDVGRAYGIQDMYRDFNSQDCMRFEKLLSQLEFSASVFLKIISGSKDISLTRAQLADFKKFLVNMMYRSERRRQQYVGDTFDTETRISIQRYMKFNNISIIQEVWFENLKWVIKTSTKDIGKELQRARVYEGDPMLTLLLYQGPIHIVELMDIGVLVFNYVCIWQAEKGSEFILSDNGFGCFEGDLGITFHNFFVISPQYAVVLVNRSYMGDVIKTFPLPLRTSWFEEFHANPGVSYKKGKEASPGDYTMSDVFKYRRLLLPKKKVFLLNSIILDARHKYISYRSNAVMYQSLVFYNKNKEKYFHELHDYSILKGKLFVELNRTHQD
ncbi:hypothetical protein BGX28_006290 [Mortierella sp. GBA30]|nr:hypothetical protein BGX28_006290 [Mortierella sp. GBA30]